MGYQMSRDAYRKWAEAQTRWGRGRWRGDGAVMGARSGRDGTLLKCQPA